MTNAPLLTFRSRCVNPYFGFVIVCWMCANGCATQPYRFGKFHPADKEQPNVIAFEYGQPQKVLDGMAWFTGIWSRMLTMNRHVNNHELTDKTKQKLIAYLEDNDLEDVLVRVNQYDPKGEWRRLRENDRIAPGYKYTMGILSLAGYTILPGRVFGGDEYNPYTNSLYINSDVAAIALHEAAYAKDIRLRSMPGTYAFVNEIPLASLWRHTNGINDVLGYARMNNDWKVESETYKVIYPQMGIYSTAFYGPFLPFWDGLLLSVAGATAGHVTGQVALNQAKRQQDSELNDLDDESQSGPEALQANLQVKQLEPRSIQFTNHETVSEQDESP